MPKYLVVLVGIVLFISCDSKIIFSQNKSLPNGWNKEEVIKFDFPKLDSLKTYNLFINLRNTNDYRYNNIFLIAEINFPHGKTVTDTLEYKMSNPDGSWLGTGIGSVKENKLWYKEHVSLSENGIYKISISQAVRNNGNVDGVSNLEGITDIGISVEETTQE